MASLTPREALENTRALIEFQLSQVEREVKDRECLSKEILDKLQKELDDLLSAKGHPIKQYDYATGISPFKDQEHIQNLIRSAKANIRAEEKSLWTDIQKLEWERRQLQRERAQINFSLKLLDEQSATNHQKKAR
mgnify:CR=1 FL=1